MDLQSEDNDKENTFHCSHTHRHSFCYDDCGLTLAIDRPQTTENELTTNYYCEFDNFLVANKQKIDHWTSRSRNRRDCFPLTMDQEVIVEQLEALSVHRSTEYNNWDNTKSITYSIPSTYVVDTICDKKEAAPVKYSMVDGKLYDRDMIYRYNAMSHTWLPICNKSIALPEFKSASGKVDSKIVPLSINAITTQFPERERNDVRHRGILQHNSAWGWSCSLSVSGDVYIDLGHPQIVTHIGTIGSFLKTKWYPEHLNDSNYYGTYNRRRFRRKYNQGIIVEDDQGAESWCVSYRLMYKKAANEPYEYIGNYKANQNCFELVVNDLRSNLPSIPIRYLLLKPISNRPRNFPAYSSCRMSIALYGKKPDTPLKKQWDDADARNEVEMIKYTLCIPPAKLVRFKQWKATGLNYYRWDCRNDATKHTIKHRLMGDALTDAADFFNSAEEDTDEESADFKVLEYLPSCGGPGYCSYCSRIERGLSTDALHDGSSSSSSVTVDMRLDDVSLWPPLPATATAAAKNERPDSGDETESCGESVSDGNLVGAEDLNSNDTDSSEASYKIVSNNSDDEWEYV